MSLFAEKYEQRCSQVHQAMSHLEMEDFPSHHPKSKRSWVAKLAKYRKHTCRYFIRGLLETVMGY